MALLSYQNNLASTTRHWPYCQLDFLALCLLDNSNRSVAQYLEGKWIHYDHTRNSNGKLQLAMMDILDQIHEQFQAWEALMKSVPLEYAMGCDWLGYYYLMKYTVVLWCATRQCTMNFLRQLKPIHIFKLINVIQDTRYTWKSYCLYSAVARGGAGRPVPPQFFSWKVKTYLYKTLKIKYYQATVWEKRPADEVYVCL